VIIHLPRHYGFKNHGVDKKKRLRMKLRLYDSYPRSADEAEIICRCPEHQEGFERYEKPLHAAWMKKTKDPLLKGNILCPKAARIN